MSRKTGSVLLITGGGIMAVFYAIITILGIMEMIEEEDFASNFMETILPLLVFAGGAVEVIVGISNRKRNGALVTGELVPLIAAIILAFIGVFVGSGHPLSLVIAIIGIAAPALYFIAVKRNAAQLQ